MACSNQGLPEADVHQYDQDCKKDPGHQGFVPIGDFDLKNLPDEYQDPDIVKLVKAHAALTVFVHVKHSKVKPAVRSDDKKTSPHIKDKGSEGVCGTGTGFIAHVRLYQDKKYNHTCPCNTCQTTGQIHVGEVTIETAAHVVSNQQDCDITECKLDYDKGDDKLSKLPTLRGMEFEHTDTKRDKTWMLYRTNDWQLLGKLRKRVKHHDQMRLNAHFKYRLLRKRPPSASPNNSSNNTNMDTDHKLIIIVSHPHGCAKVVTVGKWKERNEYYDSNTQYIYETKTCPGSSGARLCILGSEREDHLHSKSSNGFNVSGPDSGDWISETMSVPASRVHLVMGPYRKKLRAIMKDTKTHMTVYQNVCKVEYNHVARVPDCELTVQGLPNNLRTAKNMVKKLWGRTDYSMAGQAGKVGILNRVEEISILSSKAHSLLADRKHMLMSLKKYGVNMYVTQDKDGDRPTLCIYGLIHNIFYARQKFEELLTQIDDDIADPLQREAPHHMTDTYFWERDDLSEDTGDITDDAYAPSAQHDIICEEIAIPASHVHVVVGQNEEKLRKIKQDANVLIWTRRSHVDSKVREKILEIYGPKENVMMAKETVENLLVQEEERQKISEEGQLRHWEEMVIPVSKVHLFKGDLELFMCMLERKASVLVWLSRQSDGSQACDKILEIYGLEQNVNNAMKIVKYFLSNEDIYWANFTWKEIAIPVSKIHLIMGENEENMDLIEKKETVLMWVSGGSDESPVANETLYIYGYPIKMDRVGQFVTSCLLPNQESGQFMHLEKIGILASMVCPLKYDFQKTLEDHASVLVWLSGQRDGSQACDEILEIFGLKQNVDKAKEIVDYFFSNKQYPWKDDESVILITVAIPALKSHFIIGENEEKVDLLKEKKNVLIYVSGGGDESQMGDKTLWIYGPYLNVLNVEKLVRFLMDPDYIGQPWQWEEIVILKSSEIVVSWEMRTLENLKKKKLATTRILPIVGGDDASQYYKILHIFGEENTVQRLKKLVENSLFYEIMWIDENSGDNRSEEKDTDIEQFKWIDEDIGDYRSDEEDADIERFKWIDEDSGDSRSEEEDADVKQITGINKDLDSGDNKNEEGHADIKQNTKANISIPALLVFGGGAEKLMEVEVKTEVTILVKSVVNYPTKGQELVILGLQHNVMKATKMIRDLMPDADYGTDEPELMA